MEKQQFDVIIIGGSYSGLAAGMALGRALFKVLIIDSEEPCNAQTPYSHNFLTQDGQPPSTIAEIGKAQVEQYTTISFFNGTTVKTLKMQYGFKVQVASGETFTGNKLIFATGIRDLLPALEGVAECWGISVLHCPFCHGYEVRNEKTGIIGNGTQAFELAILISNWTNDLKVFTNGPSFFNTDQLVKLAEHRIKVIDTPIAKLDHTNGYLKNILLNDNTENDISAVYIRSPFVQACSLPELLGCALTEDGYIHVDASYSTSVSGVFACGDNVSRMRTVANAVAAGTATGITVSRILTTERF
jgi:thioredoxin reductase